MLRCDMPTTVKVVKTRRWTYADYCRIPADRKRHEIIMGRHYVSPSPDYGHQVVSAALHHQLMRRVTDAGRGVVLAAPMDVHLAPGTVVQPDLVVVLQGNSGVLGAKKITGVPDLLVEILSPSTRRRDLRLKRRQYEAAGVQEYWIVDREARKVAQFVLHDGIYAGPFVFDRAVRMHVVRAAAIDLTKLW